jgi:hypothetical protein
LFQMIKDADVGSVLAMVVTATLQAVSLTSGGPLAKTRTRATRSQRSRNRSARREVTRGLMVGAALIALASAALGVLALSSRFAGREADRPDHPKGTPV